MLGVSEVISAPLFCRAFMRSDTDIGLAHSRGSCSSQRCLMRLRFGLRESQAGSSKQNSSKHDLQRWLCFLDSVLLERVFLSIFWHVFVSKFTKTVPDFSLLCRLQLDQCCHASTKPRGSTSSNWSMNDLLRDDQ